MTEIKGFHGEYRFLSNFFPIFITYEDQAYPSVEHAYQAAKTVLPDIRRRIAFAVTPGKAKYAGRSVQLRHDWESIKVLVMRDLLRLKFADPVLRLELLKTGDSYLEETNNWGDRYWGVCDGRGENMLGWLLMKIRAEIAAMPVEQNVPQGGRLKVMRVVHLRREKYTVYIGRPSIFGNPFSHNPISIADIKVDTREEAILEYKLWVVRQKYVLDAIRSLPPDSILGCWCKPKSCHGDFICRLYREMHGR